MIKRILLTLAGLVVVVGILAGIKTLQIRRMIDQGKHFAQPPATVTVAAKQGVTVAADLPGKVVEIAFTPGSLARAGDLLLRLDTSSEEAQLRALATTESFARTNLERFSQLLASQSISQAEYDNAQAKAEQATAQADNIRTVIAKKTIRAPFAGHLGIRMVNLGQILKEGEPIVSLQALDPIFVNFLLPQQQLARLRPGLPVRVTADALPGQAIEGTITAINPEVDPATRNIRVQATVVNRDQLLRAGMFVNVAVLLPDSHLVLAIPATAVLYAPYGDSVFVIEEKPAEKDDQPGKVLTQKFVRLGEKRGDYIAVDSGLQEGENVASTGVFKLRNGQAAVVDNTLAPEFKLAPTPENN